MTGLKLQEVYSGNFKFESVSCPESQTPLKKVFRNRSESNSIPFFLFGHCSCTLHVPISNLALAEGASISLIKEFIAVRNRVE